MEITGRSKSSIYQHIRDIPLSKKKRREIAENSRQLALRVADSRRGKALRPFKPFTEWTPESVLLTAHLMFDGEVGRTCAYSNRSQELLKRVERLMCYIYEYEPKRYTNHVTGVHRISYHNVSLAAFFLEKERVLLKAVSNLSQECQREFIRAFFDDEGCMDYRPKENKRRIRGYQNDKKVLEIIQQLLLNFSIPSKVQGGNEVVIIGKENLIRFQKEINFSKGVRINPNRTNSLWKKNLEKRKLLDMAINSFQK